jgi:hypothetical protein
MLRVATKSSQCNDAYTCPQVLEVDDMGGDVLVQGYDDVAPSVAVEAGTPAGERLVRVPRAMLIEAGRRFEQERLFDSFTQEAFRLETLPQYQLGPQEDERFRAFLQGQPLPERSPQTSPWLAQLAASTAAGRRCQRVHITPWPLSDYLRFELTTDLENVAVGEDVRVADRAIWYPELAELTQDFWLFDATTDHAVAMLMRYDEQGRFAGAEISTDRDVIARCRRHRGFALLHAIPVAAYLDKVGHLLGKVG